MSALAAGAGDSHRHRRQASQDVLHHLDGPSNLGGVLLLPPLGFTT